MEIPINDRVITLNIAMQNAHEDYVAAFQELEKYAGQKVDDVGVEKTQRMLDAVQESFAEIHPVLKFILSNHQFAKKLLDHHTEFIVLLRKEEELILNKEHAELVSQEH